MSESITITHTDLDAYARAMKAAPVAHKRNLIAAVNRITTEGEARAKKYVPTDTHHLQRSITMVPAHDAGGAIRGAWGTNLPYAQVVEEGRSAGSAMPPSGALLGWMGRHGIPDTMEFVVRRAIGRKGIPAKRYMARSRSEIKPLARRELQAAIAKTLAGIRARR